MRSLPKRTSPKKTGSRRNPANGVLRLLEEKNQNENREVKSRAEQKILAAASCSALIIRQRRRCPNSTFSRKRVKP